jgi:tetratricopeptide (TPR) repeat protein
MSRRRRIVLSALTGALLLAACDRPDDQRTGAIQGEDVRAARAELDPAVADALDNGNSAYRAREYEQALEHYQTAVELDESVAAGWFGIYMAQLALGDDEAAEAAMEQARQHAPDATLMHPDPDRPVPADQPAPGDTLP